MSRRGSRSVRAAFVSILRANEIVVPREHPDGTHRPNGVFIGRGPDIRAGEQIDPIDILDITPLMLYFLGLPIPEDLEGQVPEQILSGESLQTRPVEQSGTTAAAEPSDQPAEREPSPEEREALLRQMKLLGYMD